jgi:hypothetical protein
MAAIVRTEYLAWTGLSGTRSAVEITAAAVLDDIH